MPRTPRNLRRRSRRGTVVKRRRQGMYLGSKKKKKKSKGKKNSKGKIIKFKLDLLNEKKVVEFIKNLSKKKLFFFPRKS